MTDLNRRDLLRLSLSGLAAGPLLGSTRPLSAMATAGALPDSGTGKLLIIFERGAKDGVLTCIPKGDRSYPRVRQTPTSTAYVDPVTDGLPLFGSTYAVMNRALGALAGADAAGHVAWLHQVGNPGGRRSLFNEMDIVESADPQPSHQLNKEGWVARLGADPTIAPGSPIATCSNSTLMQRMFRTLDTATLQAHIRDLEPLINKNFETGLKNHLQTVGTTPAEQAIVAATGQQMVDVQTELLAATTQFSHSSTHFPHNDAEAAAAGLPASPGGTAFLGHLEEAFYLLQHTSCRVAGVELGGFDTHANEVPQLNDLLNYLGHGIKSVYDLTAPNEQITVLSMSEFGRTAYVNGNNGTDHGVGGLMMAIGRGVRGGVYNCHGGSGLGATWTALNQLPGIDSGDLFANACYVRTHFLAIFVEILEDIFNITTPTTQASILPGLLNASGPELQPLDFLL